MKLIIYELKKVLGKKVFFIILALCLGLNLGIFYFVQENSDYRQFIRSDYLLITDEYSSYSLDEAEEKLSNESKVYEILSVMDMASDVQSDEEMNDLLNTLDEYKTNYPAAYAEAEEMGKSSEYNENRETYIFTLLNQVEYIKSYPAFINQMYSRAEEQSSFSIFSDQNEFSYKNLYKTADDYAHLSNVKLTIGNDLPVTSALKYNISDFFLIALVFLVCIYLFNQERELGLYNLVRSSKNGRFKTICAKFCALFIIAVIITVVFVISNFVISSYLYGRFDLNRMVQSIPDFRNCIFKLTVGQFCMLNILGKSAVMIIASSVLALLFVCFSSSSIMYITGAVILAAEYMLNSFIPTSTVFSYLKYINLFYMLDSYNFWGNYLNLNILSDPVPAYIINIIVFSVIFIVCITAAVTVFTLKSQGKKENYLLVVIEKFKSNHFKIKGSTRVINGEIYKYLILNRISLVIIAVIVFGIISSTGTIKYPYSTKSDPAYRIYMEYLEGDITSEKEFYISEQQDYFNNLHKRIDDIINDDSLTVSTKEVAENTITNILETKGAALERVTEQYNRLLNLKSIGIEAKFIDENLYPDFVYSPAREWNNLILTMLELMLSIPFIFTVEYKKEIINLISSTRFGKLRLFLSKLSVTFVTLLIIFASVYAPYIIRFIRTFGTGSFSVPIVCLNSYQTSIGTINVIGAFALCTMCYFAIALLAAAIIMFVSVFLRNHMLSMIIATIIVIIPCLIIYSNKFIRVGIIFSSNYPLFSSLIISVCIIIALLCVIIAAFRFTNTEIRRKKNAGSRN